VKEGRRKAAALGGRRKACSAARAAKKASVRKWRAAVKVEEGENAIRREKAGKAGRNGLMEKGRLKKACVGSGCCGPALSLSAKKRWNGERAARTLVGGGKTLSAVAACAAT
jgi:hypothetical protein